MTVSADADPDVPGAEEVLARAEALGGAVARRRLEAELAALDRELLVRQRRALTTVPPVPDPADLQAPELLPPSTVEAAENAEARRLGLEALAAGRVAVVTLAGGQASRLGFEGPKGAFPLGPISGASLFQILAARLRRAGEVVGRPIPWVLLTGPDNDAATRAFFARHADFGLAPGQVRFVRQGTLPALSPEGDFLLAAPDRLFRNPDGHGGLYRALEGSGAHEALAAAGVDLLFTCQVDNALVPLVDPVFLGHHLRTGARITSKAVEKTDPAEKVGLLAEDGDGRGLCVEYSDMPAELQAERAADGGLRFRAGNVAIHVLDLDLAREVAASDLPLHLARKRARVLGDDGLVGERDVVKFETFLFDAMPLAGPGKARVQLGLREDEFAPLKNRSGADSSATARAALVARDRRWLEAAGLAPPSEGPVELLPGAAWDVADLLERRSELRERLDGRLWSA